MRSKLEDMINVCLITMILIAPAVGVFFLILFHHWQTFSPPTLWMPNIRMLNAAIAAQVPFGIALIIFLLLGFCLGICYQEFFKLYRAAALREQIYRLERIWQQEVKY